MTPEKKADIAERYGWQEGERDALQRDISERKRRDAHDEAVAWAKRQVAAKAEAERQSQAEPLPIERSTETKPMTTQPTDDWVRYIKRQVSKSERLMADCVGEVFAGVEKNHKAALDEVRQELAALKSEVSELRGELKTRAALADMEARLARMETTPTPARLKTVS